MNEDSTFPVGIDGDQLSRVNPPTSDGVAWRWRRAHNVVEELTIDGRPKRVFRPDGRVETYGYMGDGGNVSVIVDDRGRTLRPIYDPNVSGRVVAYELPDNSRVSYGYTDRLMTSVIFADGSARGLIYAPSGTAGLVVAPLVGLTDELGKRTATYEFIWSNGLPISTEGANGVNKYVLNYGSNYTMVTPPVASAF